MHASQRGKIIAFLRKGVLPGGSQMAAHWKAWREQVEQFGKEAIPLYLEMLEKGRFDEQYTSLIALRHHGWEAWQEGSGKTGVFKLRPTPNDEWRSIKPDHPDDHGYRKETGEWVEVGEE